MLLSSTFYCSNQIITNCRVPVLHRCCFIAIQQITQSCSIGWTLINKKETCTKTWKNLLFFLIQNIKVLIIENPTIGNIFVWAYHWLLCLALHTHCKMLPLWTKTSISLMYLPVGMASFSSWLWSVWDATKQQKKDLQVLHQKKNHPVYIMDFWSWWWSKYLLPSWKFSSAWQFVFLKPHHWLLLCKEHATGWRFCNNLLSSTSNHGFLSSFSWIKTTNVQDPVRTFALHRDYASYKTPIHFQEVTFDMKLHSNVVN